MVYDGSAPFGRISVWSFDQYPHRPWVKWAWSTHLFTLLSFSLSLFHHSGTYCSDLLISHMRKQCWSEMGPDGRDCGLICWSMWERQDFPRSWERWENELREREYWLILLMRGFFARLFRNVYSEYPCSTQHTVPVDKKKKKDKVQTNLQVTFPPKHYRTHSK